MRVASELITQERNTTAIRSWLRQCHSVDNSCGLTPRSNRRPY